MVSMALELSESDMEEIIAKHPEIIEDGLTLLGRQVSVGHLRADLLFRDKFGDTLVVELKKGNIKREHVGQIMEYSGTLYEQRPVRLMLVGNRVPPSFRRSLEYHGIEWREMTNRNYIEYLKDKDPELLEHLQTRHLQPIISPEKPKERVRTKRIKPGEQRFWIFQTNPRRYRIFQWFSVVGEIDDWSINQYQDEIRKGDMAAIWVAGKDDIAGIYAIAEIITDPELMFQDPKGVKFWVKEEDRKEYSKTARLQVKIRYVKKFFDNPILRPSIREDPTLSELKILRFAQKTNFPVTDRQWQRTMELAGLTS